jgi:hypothetical protein
MVGSKGASTGMSPVKIALIVLVIGVIILVMFKKYVVDNESAQTLATSDAQRIEANVAIGVDNWAGYYPLCSSHFRTSMRNEGILTTCENDNADIEERFKKLKRGDLQFAVATIDAYLALGNDYQFPGTIVAVIDESKGGDAIVAYEQTISSIDDIKGNTALRIALTPDSPSEHLTRSMAVHFDVKMLLERGRWMVNADGSEDALNMLQNQKVDAAVLWEPDVTKALQINGVKKILGSEDTEKLIVDVLLVNRDFLDEKPALVKRFISAYFDTLQFYKSNPNNLVRELSKETGLKQQPITARKPVRYYPVSFYS